MIIRTDHLAKRFNRDWIIKDFDYTFESGKMYAVTGPNGCGKSTLLQMLWGQMPPSNGTIQYQDNEVVIGGEDIFSKVSIAAPYMELIDEFTLQEAVSFHFRFKKQTPGLTTEAIIENMQLTDARDKLISNFSSGMKQRLKLALAFYSDTPVLFLDEPTTNLDRKAWKWYRDHLSNAVSRLIIIASNQDDEYPENAEKIQLGPL